MGAETASIKLYVQALKEHVDKVIREIRSNPQRVKELIIKEVRREAKKVLKHNNTKDACGKKTNGA